MTGVTENLGSRTFSINAVVMVLHCIIITTTTILTSQYKKYRPSVTIAGQGIDAFRFAIVLVRPCPVPNWLSASLP